MSAKRDALANVSPAATILPQAIAANVSGTGVEVRGFEEVEIQAIVGVCTDGDYTLDIEESSDNSNWSNVAAADLDGSGPTIAAANDDQIFRIGYMGSARYIRVNVVEGTNGTTGVVMSVVIERRRPHHAPA